MSPAEQCDLVTWDLKFVAVCKRIVYAISTLSIITPNQIWKILRSHRFMQLTAPHVIKFPSVTRHACILTLSCRQDGITVLQFFAALWDQNLWIEQ